MVTISLPDPWARPEVAAALLQRPADARTEAGGAGLEATEAEADRIAFCLATFGWAVASAEGRQARATVAARRLPEPALLAETIEEVAALYGRWEVAEVRRLLPTLTARALARVRGRLAPAAGSLRTRRPARDVESVSVARPFVGFLALERHRLRHRRFDGGLSPEIERLVFASGDAVTVLPYDPRRDAVLLIEQFRAGPFARRDRLPWCVEAIAGRCDADESPEATARREAREEAGLDLGRLERVLGYYPTPAIAAEYITGFVGEADLAASEGLFGLDTEHEDIRAFVVPRADAHAAVASGEVNNAPLALSVLWLELNSERLRQDWSRAESGAPAG